MIEIKVFRMDLVEKELLEKFIKDREDAIWQRGFRPSKEEICFISMKDSCEKWMSSDNGCLGCRKFK